MRVFFTGLAFAVALATLAACEKPPPAEKRASATSSPSNVVSSAPQTSASSAPSDPMSQAAAAYDRHDFATALQIWLPLAKRGNANAQAQVGELYALGEGVRQDYIEALMWYAKAAEKRNAKAERSLGLMYEVGNGVAQDYAEARYWYQRAARLGDPPSQFLLGQIYEQGKGVPADDLTAYMWFSIAASSLSNAHDDAAKGRDNIASHLAQAELTRAQEMARDCQLSGYRLCGGEARPQQSATSSSIPMQSEGGGFVVPVTINDVIPINFLVDSGASDVSIPADVVLTLFRTNTLTEADFLGTQEYMLADGSKIPSARFRLRSLKVGDIVLHDVSGSVGDVRGTPLLGQSFLSRFKSWSIDNAQHALVLEPLVADDAPIAAPTPPVTADASPSNEATAEATATAQPPVSADTAPTSSNASFNCSKVQYIAEKTICATPALAALDNEYAEKWTSVVLGLRARRDKATYLVVRDHARAFLKQRNQCNDSTECISRAYQDIIQYLTTVM